MPGQPQELSSQSVAYRLKRLMAARCVSTRQLETLSHVDQRLIRKYRGGYNEPRDFWGRPTANAVRIAHALQVPVEELVPPRQDPFEDSAGRNGA